MPIYQLSLAADERLSDIYTYSLNNWGLETAKEYFRGLHDCFQFLAENPKAGRPFHEFRRHEFRSHIIFYQEERDKIIISLIYHKAQNIDGLIF